MKLAGMIAVTLAVVMVASVVVMAEDGEAKGPRGRRGPGARVRQHRGPRVELTEEQKAEVKKIMEAARAKAEEAESREEKMKIMVAARKQIHDEVLTDEQKAKMKKGGPRGRRGPGFEGLDLTEEQKAKIKEILESAKADAEKAETREEKAKIMRAAHKTIHETVLTEEQRKKAAARRRGGERRRGFGVELTEEQKAQVKAIMEAAKKEAAEAETPEAKREIMRAAQKKVRDEVLTEEQKAKAAERRKKMMELRKKHGGKHGKRVPRKKQPAPEAPVED